MAAIPSSGRPRSTGGAGSPGGAGAQGGARPVIATVLRPVLAVGRYLNGVLGGDVYQRYLEHRERTHPGEPVLSEREYWRARHAHEEAHPEGRCC